MSANNRNRLKTTVSAVASSGLGAFTISTAASGFRTFTAADDGLTFDDIVGVEGTAWEARNGCVYTHSTTSLSRGTLMDSSTGSAIAFTSAVVLSQGGTADFARRAESAGLRTSISSADANLTMQVGVLHCVDISGYTAYRTATLPAVAAVDDRVGLYISTGDDAYELLMTAASGDTVAGIAGGTEWSRLFITGELVVFRCIVANTTWVVEQDARIRQKAKMYLSTSADGEAAGTYTLPTSAATPGAWSDEYDNGNLSDTSNGRLYARRGGLFTIAVAYAPKDAGTTGQYANLEIRKNGTTVVGGPSAVLQSSNINRITAVMTAELPAGEYFNYYYRTADGGIGCNGALAWTCTFSITEVLR